MANQMTSPKSHETPSIQEDFSPRITSPYLLGVYLAVNAIPDAYLLLDGPSCFPLKTPSIQGNHDWFSSLSNVSGLKRCITTNTHPSTVVFSRDGKIRELLIEIAAQEVVGIVLLSARPMAAVTAVDYDRLADAARPEARAPIVVVPPNSLRSDWLGGYEQTLLALAKELPLPKPTPAPRKVAIVGYMWDRNEADHQANHQELSRLLAAMDLDLHVVWLSGGAAHDLARIQEVGSIISLPYGRGAASHLAQRLELPLVNTVLPLGFEATERFLRDIGTALDREPQAETIIDQELARWVPQLEWVIPFVFQSGRFGFIGDPHHVSGISSLIKMVGGDLAFACTNAEDQHQEEEPSADFPLFSEPTQGFLLDFVPAQQRENGLDMLLSSNVGVRLGSIPILEFGFPSYYTHALVPRPFLAFHGAVALLESMANTIRHAEL